jgi:hypothetical protein
MMTAVAVIKNFNLIREKVDVGTMNERNALDEIVEDYEN